ncbi:BTAD domain-containing putative transcriptional regulator [Streptomyces sp. GQFP]|uniref:BTAD domain-containing putative transcriptional regulator n=1 Tax=Streptomyces sp. GQFP TaxID=2907545 RepID=UPI001F1E5CFD|nr:BTAD domain-containing putative transcriptional regulator [Streptomyces sp. GQFP]UIX32866.1 winged helix-turn-helix domain-containing protein [Streptomyces sp. GQFP]
MRYRILGVTQAQDDHGTAIPIGGPRVRALLTALALRPNHTTTPETLIDEVWADTPPKDAPAALQALIGRLRRTLGKDTITSDPGGYRLAATRDDIDLHVFEHLVRQGKAALDHADPTTAARTLSEALALWRGPALADLPDRTAATRPEALRREATHARVEANLRLGRAADAVPELQELTQAHPYDEPLHALLIRALRDTGRSADALAAYETARRTLADGLGTDPGPELRTLHKELLTQPPQPPQRAAPAPTQHPHSNIRPRLTSFVGREPEIEAIRSDVHRTRLVTLIGPGGSGKTRLAEEAAAGLPQAWLVELAPLDRPEAVPGAVVSALGLRETVLMTTELTTPQDDPLALLIEYCAPRSQLLILDNCEHVIDAAAELAETLLTHCPGLTILATSREPLGVPGESVRPVEPLLPDPARRLFEERAAAVRPDADTALRDTEAVAEICRRLDGLPLAIELAAARLRLLTPRQIADRLDDRFRLLTSGSRTVLPRQQTLRAVVDWSWDLLDERERTVLREVSVFAGGWDLTAAEAVCGGQAADLMGALVDKSLIVATPHGPDAREPHEGDAPGTEPPGMRYRLLETIHEYATERAAEAPEQRAAVERRHRAWVRALVEEAEPLLRSTEQLPWIARLETELDNIRAALDRSIRDGDEEEAAALALAMGWFWWLRNFRREAMEWLTRIVNLETPPETEPETEPETAADPQPRHTNPRVNPRVSLRMNVRMYYIFLAIDADPIATPRGEHWHQRVAEVRAHFEGGGPEAARLPGLAWPLTILADADGPGSPPPDGTGTPRPRLPDVAAALDTVIANCRTHGGDWEVAASLMFRTHMVVDSPGGLLGRGVDDDLAELRVLSRRVGDRWLRAQVCSAAGEAAMARGVFEEAEGEYEEALRLAREVGAHAEAPFLIARLAEIAYREGDRVRALAALDEASAAADRSGVADSRAFVLLLRAQLALDDQDVAGARAMCERSRAEIARGTPPPQFMAGLNAMDALVMAEEHGPERGVAKLTATLREAVARGCAEVVTAAIVDAMAGLLARLDDLPRAVRLLAASDSWRCGRPRPMPERARAEETQSRARTTLGAERYESERTTGSALTVDDVLHELAQLDTPAT